MRSAPNLRRGRLLALTLSFCAALAAIFGANPAQAEFLDCTTDTFLEEKAKDPGFVCAEIRRIAVQAFGRSVGIRSLHRLGDDAVLQYEPLAMTAAETTLAWLDGYSQSNGLKVQEITFLFTDTSKVEADAPLADAQGSDPKDCVVRLNVAVGDMGGDGPTPTPVLDDFDNTIAHELFHCVQGATWPDQFLMYDEGAGWWVEGTAQFIAHWIYPVPTDLKERSETFADAAQIAPLHKAEAAGGQVVFFAWLASGNVYPIFDFIKAMPTVPGPDAQRAALLAQVPPYLLAEFVRDYLDGKVKMPDSNRPDPNGYVFPAPQPLHTTQILFSTSTAIRVEPLTLFIHDVIFAGGTYMTTGQSPADISYRREVKPQDGWSSIGLINTEQDCTEEETLRFAGMGFGTASETLTLDAMKFPGCETCVVTETRDACLVGSWLADQGELSRVIYEMVSDSAETVEVDGNFGVKFNPDGTAVFGFYKLRVKLNYATGVPVTGIDLGGSVDNLWSTDAQRLQMCYRGSKAAIQIVIPRSASKDPKTGKMTENPSTSEVINFADLPIQKSAQYDFACIGKDEMTMTGEVDGKGFTLFFNRAE
jgi:hypothetical protein